MEISLGNSIKLYSKKNNDYLKIVTPKGETLIYTLYPEAVEKINNFKTQWDELEETAFIEAVIKIFLDTDLHPSAVAYSVNNLHLKKFPLAAQAITYLVAYHKCEEH